MCVVRWVALLAGVGLCATLACPVARPAHGVDEVLTETIELRAADARAVASQLGGVAFGDSLASLARRASRRMGRGLLGTAYGPPLPAAEGGLSAMLPEGLEGPVVGLVERNALLAKGTQEALDGLRELIEQLDRPVPMVRVDLDALTTSQQLDPGRLLEWRLVGSMGSAAGSDTSGSAVPSLDLGLGDVALALGGLTAKAQGTRHEALSVMTASGSPATIAMGTRRPALVPFTALDAFGFPYTAYEVWIADVVTGLFVLPRVNAGGTVTLNLGVLFEAPVGEIIGPGGFVAPVIESLRETTVVTVADGQTMAIGGLRSVEGRREYRGAPLSLEEAEALRLQMREREVILLVTPHVIPPASPELEPDPYL